MLAAPSEPGMEPIVPPGPETPPPATRPSAHAIGFSVGQVLDRSFRLFGRRCWVLVPLALLFYALPTWLHVVVDRPGHLSWIETDALFWWFHFFGGWPGIGMAIVDWVMPLAFQAIVTFGVFQSLRSGRARWGASIGLGLRRLPHAVGASLVILLAMVLPMLLIVILLFRNPGRESPWFMLFVLFLLLLYLAWLSSRLFVGIQVAVVEGTGPFRAIGRSSWLTYHVRWKVFALLLVVVLVPYVAGRILDLGILRKITGEDRGMYLTHYFIGRAFDAAFGALQAVTAAVTYHALREAKEGVGLDELLSVFD